MSKGLEGITAAQTAISSIVGTTLTYRGYKIEDLAKNAEFEEIVYLLWFGKLPNQEDLFQLKKEIKKNYQVPKEVMDWLKMNAKKSHPMAVLRTAVSMLALEDDKADVDTKEENIKKAIRLQAKISTIVANLGRLRKGLYVIEPHPELDYAANFLYMLKGKFPENIEVDAFNKALILHADHEFNASTFSSRVTVATMSDFYSGITSAIGTLKGPLHGGANEQVMKMLLEIEVVSNVELYIKKKMDNKERIMGIGHRVYKDGDPRAFFLKEMSKKITELAGESKWYEMSEKIEEIVFNEKGLKPNVDFYSASVYHCLGITSEIFTPIFAVSRTAGWAAHMLEQASDNRLIRPRAEYIGETEATWVPLEDR